MSMPTATRCRSSASSAATNGTVAINDNGTPGDTDRRLPHLHRQTRAGLDTFSYTISDGNGGTATATVEVEVEPLQPDRVLARSPSPAIPSKNWTSLEFGPDGRLYASHRFGEIYAFDIEQQVDGNGNMTGYHAASSERIDLIKTIPNHDDDGTLNLDRHQPPDHRHPARRHAREPGALRQLLGPARGRRRRRRRGRPRPRHQFRA